MLLIDHAKGGGLQGCKFEVTVKYRPFNPQMAHREINLSGAMKLTDDQIEAQWNTIPRIRGK